MNAQLTWAPEKPYPMLSQSHEQCELAKEIYIRRATQRNTLFGKEYSDTLKEVEVCRTLLMWRRLLST